MRAAPTQALPGPSSHHLHPGPFLGISGPCFCPDTWFFLLRAAGTKILSLDQTCGGGETCDESQPSPAPSMRVTSRNAESGLASGHTDCGTDVPGPGDYTELTCPSCLQRAAPAAPSQAELPRFSSSPNTDTCWSCIIRKLCLNFYLSGELHFLLIPKAFFIPPNFK